MLGIISTRLQIGLEKVSEAWGRCGKIRKPRDVDSVEVFFSFFFRLEKQHKFNNGTNNNDG